METKTVPFLFGRHRQSRNGSGDRFRELVLPHLDGAYNLACYLTRDPVLSQDIVQDAFVRALRGFAGYRGGSPKAWLFAIVRNCCRTSQRGAGGAMALVIHESSLSDDAAEIVRHQADLSPSPEEEVIRSAEINALRQAIEEIPEPFREAVVLRDMEELSYAEIAEVTGVPVGTVMSRLSRARAMLAKALLPQGKNGNEASREAK